VKQLRFLLKLDSNGTQKMPTYYLYRSEELNDGRPIVDGFYVQRSALGSTPPDTLSILLEWNS